MRTYMTEYPGWISFYPKLTTGFFIEKAGYFDERPQIHTSITQLLAFILMPFLLMQSLWFLFVIPFLLFGWGTLYINLPIRTGIQDCDSAAWGLAYHDNTLWIYIGGAGNLEGGRKIKTIEMPWCYTWVRTSTEMRRNVPHGAESYWYHETPQNRQTWEEDKDGTREGSHNWLKLNRWQWVYPFTDKYDGTVVNATVSIVEREWRPIWFKWTKLFAKTRRCIEVEFDKEVGKEKGSWKGGCTGCGYELKAGETAYQSLKRMEAEREF